jgi:3-hydroxybutyryl-CoA dehydrogenase
MAMPAPSGGEAKSVLVIGCGLMGSQLAVDYAAAGHSVSVAGRDLDAANDRLAQAVEVLRRHRDPAPDALASAEGLVGAAAGLDSLALEQIDIAVECVAEDLAAKAAVLKPVAAASPAAILATNTSSLRVTDLGEAVGAPTRVIGTHYWNPPLLMPAVEVIRGEDTAPAVQASVTALLRAMGKVPIDVRGDVPGFVWNRLQAALLREALWLVDNDVATAAAIDDAVRYGLAPRATYTGVFGTVELGGPEVWNALMANVVPALSNVTEIGDVGPRLDGAEPGELELLKSRRDQGLAARLRDLRSGRRAA